MTTEWPIDGIPDDALPRLLPRPLVSTDTGVKIYDPQDKDKSTTTGFFVLVALTDCAPFLGTWPPDLDELVAVATRLLLVAGGPQVGGDGRATPLRRPTPGGRPNMFLSPSGGRTGPGCAAWCGARWSTTSGDATTTRSRWSTST